MKSQREQNPSRCFDFINVPNSGKGNTFLRHFRNHLQRNEIPVYGAIAYGYPYQIFDASHYDVCATFPDTHPYYTLLTDYGIHHFDYNHKHSFAAWCSNDTKSWFDKHDCQLLAGSTNNTYAKKWRTLFRDMTESSKPTFQKESAPIENPSTEAIGLSNQHNQNNQNINNSPYNSYTKPKQTMEKYDAFISCKSEDYPFAEEIYEFLTANKINVFLASKELRRLADSDYRDAIENALESAEHIIVFASNPDYIKSKWVKYEWGLFLNAKLNDFKSGNIITVLKDCTPKQIAFGLQPYESLKFENYKEAIVNYVETEESRKRLEEAKKDAEEEAKKQLEVLGRQLIEQAEKYHTEELPLRSRATKIKALKKQLQLNERQCPVCECRSDADSCPRCGWKFSPIDGIPGAEYLIDHNQTQIDTHRQLFLKVKGFETELQSLRKELLLKSSLINESNKTIADLKEELARCSKSKASDTYSSSNGQPTNDSPTPDGTYEVWIIEPSLSSDLFVKSFGIYEANNYQGKVAAFDDRDSANLVKLKIEARGAKAKILKRSKTAANKKAKSPSYEVSIIHPTTACDLFLKTFGIYTTTHYTGAVKTFASKQDALSLKNQLELRGATVKINEI